MIVYRDQRVSVDPAPLLSTLRRDVLQLAGSGAASHEVSVELLIRMGSIEAALDDAIFPTADSLDSMARRLRETSLALGHVLWHTWQEQARGAKRWLEQAAATLAHLELQSLPVNVQISVPEGYAYYAVYPETYLEAARSCRRAMGSFNAVCLGLRSIGTSLSAAVAATLEELGCRVSSYTLRPRGHPFARRPVLSSDLEAVIRAERDALFLIVDEGPGISGSSLGGAAELLGDLGIDDERIIFFPSWATDGSRLLSAEARTRWRRHRQFVVGFEEVWLRSGRLGRTLPPGRLRDISAGAWRDELYPYQTTLPPIHPQHERRKYLLSTTDDISAHGSRWLSFVGLGERVTPKLRRAEQLACAGFMPPPELVVNGFLVRPFTPGTPISTQEQPSSVLFETVASYLAYISRQGPAEPSVTAAGMEEMIRTNVAEGLGEGWLERLESTLSEHGAGWCERPVEIDGRMQPHEWIRTAAGYLKTDAVDHHDDHFFPGCQDVAWDVAATCLEFDLAPSVRRQLVQRYAGLSHDITIGARLPIHALAYLAFRLGYATLAADTLGDVADGKRFVAARDRYRQQLRTELSNAPRDLWHA